MKNNIIGYDAKRAFRNRTGLGNYSRMIISGVLRRHDDMWGVLYTPPMRNEYTDYFDGLAKVEIRRPSRLWRFVPWLWRTLGFVKQLQNDRIQLYHGLSHELPVGVPEGVRQVVTMHDLIVLRYPQYFKPFDRVVHRLKQRRACREADVIVAISEQTRRDLIDMMQVPEEKIRVIYQSCDPIFWHPVSDAAVEKARARYALPARYIICVGTIEERKNQLCAVRALQHLPSDIGLVIVGRRRGKYPCHVDAEIARLGLSDRVLMLNNASFADFPALYHGAVASVYMSRFEGFGIPVLESLCCDTPVVTSSTSSMPEAGGDAAFYADPDDPLAVAAHLSRLATDDAFRSAAVERGRLQRQRFTPEIIADQIYNLYRELLG